MNSLREILAFVFEASVMAGQSQQTAITRKLAAWAANTRRSDRDRRNLRHELRTHAGIEVAIRLLCLLAHRRQLRYALSASSAHDWL